MQVYFAGSIKGGRSDALLYNRMIGYIKEKGYRVLTEHVGDLDLKEVLSAEEIYQRDIDWLKEADILIAECTNPSLGVGYELAYAERCNVPCHVFYNCKRTVLSAMLSGDPYFKIHPYESEDEIYGCLDDLLDSSRD